MPQIIPAVVAAISYVGTATAAVVAGTATLAQIATVAAVGIGAGVGSMAVSKALTPEIGSQGAAVRWEANPDAPLRFPFGRVGVKGNIIDAAVYGPDRMYVSFACVVGAAGPIKRFVTFRAGDYIMSFNGAGQAVNEPYAGEMWLSTRLGAQPDTALSLPSGLKNGAAFPGWNSGRKLSGSAGYLVTLGENSKRSAYDGKIPAFLTVIEGLFCYDPRLDDTYPGGAGPCRLNNPATWVWTENPILFGLKWALGLWEGPTGKGAPQVDYQVGGIGAKVEGIHLASFVEAANVSDANGWKGAAWPSTDDDKAQVLDGFLKAGGSSYAEIGGKIACIHRAAPRAPVFTVTVRDTAGPIEIDTASSKLNRINTIRPRYWSEAHEWEMTALPEVTATEWQEEDGQGVAVKRTRGADYTFVPLPKQARELASLEISNSREGIKGRVPLRPYMDPEPGNTFIFDEPDFALSDLKCIVLDVEDDTENDTVIVTFETETDGKYPFAYGQTASPPPAQELDPRDPFFVSPPGAGDWTITPRPPAPGGQLPGFDLGGIVSNDTATSIIVEHGPTDDGPWKQAYEGPPTVTNIPIDGLQPGATYYIAIQYRRDNNYSARHVYGPYEAPPLIADVMPNAPGLSEIKADIEAAFGDIFDVGVLLGQTRSDLETADAALGSAIGSLDTRADILEIQTQSLEENKASVGSLNAQIVRINGVEAVNAEAIQQVTARLATRRNEVRNATGALGLQYWNGSGFSAGTSFWGPFLFTTVNGNQALYSDPFAVAGNGQYTIQVDIEHQSVAGLAGANILWFNGATALGFSPSISTALNRNFTNAAPLSLTVTAPSNATRGQLRLFVDGHSNGYIAWRRAKVELGPNATGWTDDATTDAIGASVTEQALAIIDVENQLSLASWSIKAAATGGKPTILQLLSGSFGSSIAMTAEQIFFGDNTFFEDATDTLQTTVGNVRYPVDYEGPLKFPKHEAIAKAMKAAAAELGVKIQWGGDWKGFVDRPHYELKS